MKKAPEVIIKYTIWSIISKFIFKNLLHINWLVKWAAKKTIAKVYDKEGKFIKVINYKDLLYKKNETPVIRRDLYLKHKMRS